LSNAKAERANEILTSVSLKPQAVESLQFLHNFYQRMLSTSYIMNPGIGSSIFLSLSLLPLYCLHTNESGLA